MSLFRYLGFGERTESASVAGDAPTTWVILFATFLVQMTVPSVLSIYAVVLGYLATTSDSRIDPWSEQIIFTPILFAAFWSLEDPWSRAVIDMAPVPRLVGVIGAILLAIGFLASGYLATGGLGAYLASLSAGAVMGIGASFLLVHAENVLWRFYKTRLPFAMFVKNAATSMGHMLVPILIYTLLRAEQLKTGLLIAAVIFAPTLLGALLLRPPLAQTSMPYTLLLFNEQQETHSSLEVASRQNKNEVEPGDSDEPANLTYPHEQSKAEGNARPIFGEGHNNYFYDDPNQEVNIFINPALSAGNTWKQEFECLRSKQFWVCAFTCATLKVTQLYFWILLPSMLSAQITTSLLREGVALLVIAGFGALLSALLFYLQAKSTIRRRRLYFAGAFCLGGVVFLGLTYCSNYTEFVICALLGGISVSSTSIYQQPVLSDLLGTQAVRRISNALSTVTGVATLFLCFTYDVTFALNFVAVLQFISGFYWLVTSFVVVIRA